MAEQTSIDLMPEQLREVKTLIKRYLPNTKAWAYGSRVRWNARPGSDLDLVVFATPEQQAEVSELREAFAESNLPFPVDLFIWDQVPERFRGNILGEYKVLQGTKVEIEKAVKAGWKEYRLGDITGWASGGTPPKSKPEYWRGDIPWISASSMDGNRYSDSKLKVTKLGLQSGTKLALKDTILLLVRGSILHQKIQVGIAEKDVSFNQDVKAITIKGGIVEPWFLLLWFMAKEEELLNLVENTGIGSGKLDTKILQNIKVMVPPDGERHRILTFAKAIEDKVELNRQTNQTLESMAQALFKSWFVDFDPVIDNTLAKGNPIPEQLQQKAATRKAVRDDASRPKLPEHIQKLFPSEFELSEQMGWVPKGWQFQPLSSISVLKTKSCQPNKEPDKLWTHYSIPAFDDGSIPAFDLGSEIKSSKYFVSGTSVLISKLNPETQRVWMPSVADQASSICSTEFMPFVPAKEGQRSFLYSLLVSDDVQIEICNRATGSTGSRQRVRPKEIAAMDVLVPSDELMTHYAEICSEWLSRVSLNLENSCYLTRLRDALLPKFISGNLKVPAKEKIKKIAR